MPGKDAASTRHNATSFAVNDIDGQLPDANGLRARARRYRKLAESLFDSRVITIVLDCATELDEKAGELLEGRNWSNRFSD